jgi:chromosome segregation ATPase
MSRKKQIEELRAQLEQLRSAFAESEDRRHEQTGRLDSIEVIIDGHDATLDNTSEILRSFPAPDAVARVDQVADLSSSTSRVLAVLNDTVGAQQQAIAAQQALIAEQRNTIDSLRVELERLGAATSQESARIQARLAEISQQLTRQVDEIGMEVEAAARRADEAAHVAAEPLAALEQVRANQTKLASEQVRYDLALRAELAELAERVRRATPR